MPRSSSTDPVLPVHGCIHCSYLHCSRDFFFFVSLPHPPFGSQDGSDYASCPLSPPEWGVGVSDARSQHCTRPFPLSLQWEPGQNKEQGREENEELGRRGGERNKGRQKGTERKGKGGGGKIAQSGAVCVRPLKEIFNKVGAGDFCLLSFDDFNLMAFLETELLFCSPFYLDLSSLCCTPISPCSYSLPTLCCVVSPLVVDWEPCQPDTYTCWIFLMLRCWNSRSAVSVLVQLWGDCRRKKGRIIANNCSCVICINRPTFFFFVSQDLVSE